MSRRLLHGWLPLFAMIATLAMSPAVARATEIWSGRTFAFSKSPFANPTLAVTQDHISPLVWITRGNTQGIYNIHLESSYVHNVSPAGTEWATGDAVNHASLVFKPWEVWAGVDPPSTVGVNACVHLITEDIYVDIVFDSWGSGTSGGYFSYRRGVQQAVPTRASTWGRIKSLYR